MKKKICIIGLGYIGLPTAAMFSEYGCEVVGVDISEKVVNKLNQGVIHIEEPGLGEIIKKQVAKGNFRASLLPEQADAFIIAVPTPNLEDEYRSCDLTYVLEGVKEILPYLQKGNTVIVESTIAPKSMDDFVKPIIEDAGYVIGKDIYLAHCPERVLPGKILNELRYNNRIVGGITEACTNELAKICYELDINCLDVIKMANKHPRVNLHQPGPGVGGHCLAIDPYFICAKAPETARLIALSRQTNCSMPEYVADKVQMLLEGIVSPKVAAFGMSYKGNIDDVRESPAVSIINILKNKGISVEVYDPHVENAGCVELESAVTDADLVLILTDHNEYKNLDHKYIAGLMRTPKLFDTRNIIKRQQDSGLEIINYGNLYKFKKN